MFGQPDRLPPTGLSSIWQKELYDLLFEQADLYLFPTLVVLLDPFQYGLPVDLLLDRALCYLQALLVEDNLFAPDNWVEPPPYPEPELVPPVFEWTSPAS